MMLQAEQSNLEHVTHFTETASRSHRAFSCARGHGRSPGELNGIVCCVVIYTIILRHHDQHKKSSYKMVGVWDDYGPVEITTQTLRKPIHKQAQSAKHYINTNNTVQVTS